MEQDKVAVLRGSIRKIIADAGFAAFSYDGSRTRGLSDTAEQLLQGLSHYFDKGTRRSFGSRVLKLESLCHGAVLGCIESVAPPHSAKAYRPVFFDFTGTAIHRPRADESYATYQRARTAYSDYAAQLDWVEVIRAALANEQRIMERKLRDIKYAQTLLESSAQVKAD